MSNKEKNIKKILSFIDNKVSTCKVIFKTFINDELKSIESVDFEGNGKDIEWIENKTYSPNESNNDEDKHLIISQTK